MLKANSTQLNMSMKYTYACHCTTDLCSGNQDKLKGGLDKDKIPPHKILFVSDSFL